MMAQTPKDLNVKVNFDTKQFEAALAKFKAALARPTPFGLRQLTQDTEIMDAANARISTTSDVRTALEAVANAIELAEAPEDDEAELRELAAGGAGDGD
jgi:hypothetical protein